MAKITAISNQKGGVGKTTTVQALAAGLRAAGQSVLLIDLDPQSNLSFAMGADISDGTPSIYEVMKGSVSAEEVIQQTENGEIMPASLLLSAAELEFNKTGREHIIEKAIAPIVEQYDQIIIDTPPALNVLTENAYTAADQVIITMNADAFSVQGALQLAGMINDCKEYTNPDLQIGGILICKYSDRTNVNKAIREQIEALAAKLGTKVYKTTIRESVVVKEAQTMHQNLQSYAAGSNPAKDYEEFVAEFME